MVNIKRAALEILNVGLYDPILQEALKISDKPTISEIEIEELLVSSKELLGLYKKLNVEYNIGNVHVVDFAVGDETNAELLKDIKHINKNLFFLRENEKYTIDFAESSTLLSVMSVEFFVIFSVQYFIVLLDMKEWQTQIYGLFASSIVVAWLYVKKQKKLYKTKNKEFLDIYDKTLEDIENLRLDYGISPIYADE